MAVKASLTFRVSSERVRAYSKRHHLKEFSLNKEYKVPSNALQNLEKISYILSADYLISESPGGLT